MVVKRVPRKRVRAERTDWMSIDEHLRLVRANPANIERQRVADRRAVSAGRRRIDPGQRDERITGARKALRPRENLLQWYHAVMIDGRMSLPSNRLAAHPPQQNIVRIIRESLVETDR